MNPNHFSIMYIFKSIYILIYVLYNIQNEMVHN